MKFTKASFVLALALGFSPLASARAQDNQQQAGQLTGTVKEAPAQPAFQTQARGWAVKKDGLVYFVTTKRAPARQVPNLESDDLKKEANRHKESYLVLNEPFRTIIAERMKLSDQFDMTGTVRCGAGACTTQEAYEDSIKTVIVSSITVRNFSKDMVPILKSPRADAEKFDESILPATNVTITNVVRCNNEIFYEVSIPTSGLPVKGYVSAKNLKVGGTADLLAKLGAGLTAGTKTGLTATRDGIEYFAEKGEEALLAALGIVVVVTETGVKLVLAGTDIVVGTAEGIGNGAVAFGKEVGKGAKKGWDKAKGRFQEKPSDTKGIAKELDEKTSKGQNR